MDYKANYLALRYMEPGQYIPAHDPSFCNETLDKAVAEAQSDITDRGAPAMAIYQLVSVLEKDNEEPIDVVDPTDV